MTLTLPSAIGGATTRTVGIFRTDWRTFSEWHQAALNTEVSRVTSKTSLLRDAIDLLEPSTETAGMKVIMDWDGWTLALTGGPLGTDMGALPSHAATRLGVLSIRATVSEGPGEPQGAILEVFDPDVDSNSCLRRYIVASRDGSWKFMQYGTPFPFERTERYENRRIRDRFNAELMDEYLVALGAPRSAASLDAPGVADLHGRPNR